jgi:hypothetical protein
MNRICINWRRREPPLAPCAALARGEAALHLVRRMLGANDEQLGSWRGVAGRNIIVVLGEESTLPWVEEVLYLGQDGRAPSLLLPTTLTIDTPLVLFERAMLSHISSLNAKLQSADAQLSTAAAPLPAIPPFAVLPEGYVISLGTARPLARSALQQWLRAPDFHLQSNDEANSVTLATPGNVPQSTAIGSRHASVDHTVVDKDCATQEPQGEVAH